MSAANVTTHTGSTYVYVLEPTVIVSLCVADAGGQCHGGLMTTTMRDDSGDVLNHRLVVRDHANDCHTKQDSYWRQRALPHESLIFVLQYQNHCYSWYISLTAFYKLFRVAFRRLKCVSPPHHSTGS